MNDLKDFYKEEIKRVLSDYGGTVIRIKIQSENNSTKWLNLNAVSASVLSDALKNTGIII